MGDFADLVDRERSILRNFSQMFAGGIVCGESGQSDQRPIFHDQQVLTQTIVQFSRKAFALGLL